MALIHTALLTVYFICERVCGSHACVTATLSIDPRRVARIAEFFAAGRNGNCELVREMEEKNFGIADCATARRNLWSALGLREPLSLARPGTSCGVTGSYDTFGAKSIIRTAGPLCSIISPRHFTAAWDRRFRRRPG